MVRLAGILCGSAIAISSLIVFLGVPELLPEPVNPPDPEPAVTLPEPAEPDDDTNEALPKPQVAADIQDVAAPEPEAPQAPKEQPAAAADSPGAPATEAEHWFAFWSPFRSELAANGFVAQLQRSTGIDYRVVQLKPGAYEVAFAYRDDADIAAHLATISAATGLELPGE